MTVGILMTAWALDAFLIPNRIAAGGISGLSTVTHYWLLHTFNVSITVGVQMLVFNGILLIIAWRVRGVGFLAKTIYGAVALSIAVDVLGALTPQLASNDLLLAALYGGAISGLGMGLVFKAGGNTGGTDIVAQLLARRVPLGVGQLMLVVDVTVTLLAALQFGPGLAMYGAVAIVVMTLAIDLVLEGVSVEKAVLIISDAMDAIGDSVTHELGRGATRLEATGVWTGQRRGALYVVLSRNELDDLKAIVAAHDPTAMVVISNVHEAIGEGFREMA